MAVPARPVPGNPIASDWGDVTHDAVVAQDIQRGTIAVTGTGGSTAAATLVFPRPFAGANPTVTAVVNAGSGFFCCGLGSMSPTQCTVTIFRRDGANFSGAINVDWIAIGPRT